MVSVRHGQTSNRSTRDHRQPELGCGPSAPASGFAHDEPLRLDVASPGGALRAQPSLWVSIVLFRARRVPEGPTGADCRADAETRQAVGPLQRRELLLRGCVLRSGRVHCGSGVAKPQRSRSPRRRGSPRGPGLAFAGHVPAADRLKIDRGRRRPAGSSAAFFRRATIGIGAVWSSAAAHRIQLPNLQMPLSLKRAAGSTEQDMKKIILNERATSTAGCGCGHAEEHSHRHEHSADHGCCGGAHHTDASHSNEEGCCGNHDEVEPSRTTAVPSGIERRRP